jgi:hypothetical protein
VAAPRIRQVFARRTSALLATAGASVVTLALIRVVATFWGVLALVVELGREGVRCRVKSDAAGKRCSQPADLAHRPLPRHGGGYRAPKRRSSRAASDARRWAPLRRLP